MDELIEKRIALVGDNEKRLGEYTLLYDESILSNNRISIRVAPKQKPLKLNIGSDMTLLPPAGGGATIEVHSTPTIAGTLPIAADGSIHGTVPIPGSLATGFHQLHVKYKDISGRTIDRYAYVYVAESEQDYDGDGDANSIDACPIGKESGIDKDKDGIDDACDDEYVLSTASDSDNESRSAAATSQQPTGLNTVSKINVLAATVPALTDGANAFGVAPDQKLAVSSAPETSKEKVQKPLSDTKSQGSIANNPWTLIFVIVSILMALIGSIIKFVRFKKS